MSLRIALVLACLVAVAFAGKVPPQLGYLSSRIVGGVNAKKDEFPHQISLQMSSIFGMSHRCGGSIISERWILTAAHCVRGVSSIGQWLYVKAGKLMIKSKEATEQEVMVDKYIEHEEYSGGVGPYDIALIKLSKPLVLNQHVKKIALPKPNADVEGEVVLSGWGSTSPSGFGQPDNLQKVNLPVIDLETCRESIEELTGHAPLAESNVCTGPLTGGTSACSGDSGGPLIKINEGGESEVIGIVSWGIIPCGSVGAPSVYTKVSSYIDWIESTIAKN